MTRSFIAGDTNYIGATIDEMISDLMGWHTSTLETIEELKQAKREVIDSTQYIDRADDVIEFIDNAIADFARISTDVQRVIQELAASVEQRHLDIIKNLLEFANTLEDYCLDFKRVHLGDLKHEMTRPLLDRVYAIPRRQVIDYRDLSNLSYQLRTFVGTKNDSLTLTVDDVDMFELKPNVFGFGVNLNHIIKRLTKWTRRSN